VAVYFIAIYVTNPDAEARAAQKKLEEEEAAAAAAAAAENEAENCPEGENEE
jgi:hypothetical protein